MAYATTLLRASRAVAVLAAALALAGCESLQGAPMPIDPATPPKDACPTRDMLTTYAATPLTQTAPSRREQRDADIGACVSLIDGQYYAFVKQLHVQNVSTTLTLDLVSLGLTNAATLASKTTANALSAGASGVTGAGLALNKDVFYQKTLPAIIAQMDADRALVYKNIRLSEQSDETTYTLADAQHDLRDYEAAGTIDEAISAISASATQSTATSTDAVKALFTTTIVDVPTQARKKAIAQYVKNLDLTAAADKTVLNAIATAMKVSVAPGEDPLQERHDVLVALDKAIVDPASLTTVAAQLKTATGRDF
jgi:hypothetical protein